MHWENDNCDPIDGVNTKTCHCAEGKWVRGSGHGNLGSRIGSAYLNFYKVRNKAQGSFIADLFSDTHTLSSSILILNSQLWVSLKISSIRESKALRRPP